MVTMIAFDAGYDTPEAFTWAFRDAYAMPPSAYRLSTRGVSAEHDATIESLLAVIAAAPLRIPAGEDAVTLADAA